MTPSPSGGTFHDQELTTMRSILRPNVLMLALVVVAVIVAFTS